MQLNSKKMVEAMLALIQSSKDTNIILEPVTEVLSLLALHIGSNLVRDGALKELLSLCSAGSSDRVLINVTCGEWAVTALTDPIICSF